MRTIIRLLGSEEVHRRMRDSVACLLAHMPVKGEGEAKALAQQQVVHFMGNGSRQ